MLYYLVFVVSLATLLYGANLITKSAARIARSIGIPEFIIGATILAFGTNLPEISSSLSAVLSGVAEIAVANVIGSNVANIGLVVGVMAFVKIIHINWDVLSADIPFLICSAIATLIVLLDYKATFIEGIFLLLMYFAFTINSVYVHRNYREKEQREEFKSQEFMFLIIGFILLFLGAKYLIVSAKEIMFAWNISQAVMGFVLIGAGTSLPELATSSVAAYQGKGDIAIGNVVGSNTLNSLVVLGTCSLFAEIPISKNFMLNSVPAMVLLTFLLTFIILDRKVTKLEGVLLLLLYLLIVMNVIA